MSVIKICSSIKFYILAVFDEVISVNFDNYLKGINYSGYVEIPATLDAGQHYYTTVRAVTNNGHVLTATTDGFMVDTTPPDIQIERFAYICYVHYFIMYFVMFSIL